MDEEATTVWAFTEDQVAELTGLSVGRLRYSRRTHFYYPAGGPDAELYSFRDVVSLRTVAELRRRGVPLQELRKVRDWLKQWSGEPWASLRLAVLGRKVYLKDPKTGAWLTRIPKDQTVHPIFLETIAGDALRAAKQARKRRSSDVGKVKTSPRVMGNAPTVAGTRIPASAIWELREAGYSQKQIREEYPSLKAADVRAALAHEHRWRRRVSA